MNVLLQADAALLDSGVRSTTAVLVSDGEIIIVGDPDEVRADPRCEGAHLIDWHDRALIPGTVNAHNHSFQSLLRGIGDDMPFLEWRDKALYRYSPELGPDGMATAALFAFGEMLLHGVTTVCDFYYINDGANDNARATIEAARQLGIRIVLARCFYDWDGAPASYREDIPTAIRNFESLYKEYADPERHLTSVHPAPHSQHGATPAMIEAGAGCAKAAGTPWHIHLAEEQYQVEESIRRFGLRPLHAVDKLGVLSESSIAIHGCWFDESERELLAARGASLVYNPASNMFLGDGITDVIDLHRRGVKVGLGTDGGCSNNRVSVFDEMRMTALLQKVAHTMGHAGDQSPEGQPLDAETCLQMGTHTGAQLLDLPVGRIAPGYRADIVAVDLHDPSLWPLQALSKNTVYSLSARAITDVMVDGDVVVENRTLVRAELQEIESRVRRLTGNWSRA